MAKWTRFGPWAGALAMMGALILGSPSADAATVSIDLTPSASVVNVNNLFDVAITANIEREILGFGFDMDMPAGLLELVSVNIAAPFTPMMSPDGDGLAGLCFPDLIAGANVPLATVRLRALAPGIVQIGIGVTPGDLTEGFAEADAFAELLVNTTTVQILGQARPFTGHGEGDDTIPVPEPAGPALLLALASLVTIRRTR